MSSPGNERPAVRLTRPGPLTGPAAVTGPAVTGAAAGKPTPAGLGIDLAGVTWERSGDGGSDGNGSIEVAFPRGPRWARGDWVLMRVAGDPSGRILVFDRNEWECFIDGARNGEFDDATDRGGPTRS